MGQLVEGSTGTEVASVNCMAVAERGGFDFNKGWIAVVDVPGCGPCISDNATMAFVHRVRAAQGPCGRILVCDRVERVDNSLNVVVFEIRFESRIATTTAANISRSLGGQGFGFCEGSRNERGFGGVIADDLVALIEVEVALGNVIGDSDGDGTGIGDVETRGIRDGLDNVIEPDDLESRDGVELEGPRAGSGEIEHGGDCPGGD